MATLALAKIEHVGRPTGNDFIADVTFIGFGNPLVDSGIEVTLPRDRTQTQWNAAVKDAVKAHLQANHGYVFAGGDSVELI